jgi:hypothetical protein
MNSLLFGHQMHEIIGQNAGFQASDGDNKYDAQCFKMHMVDRNDNTYQENDDKVDQDISFKIV